MKLVELFLFTEGTTEYAQTRVSYPVVYDGRTYEPYALGRSEAESKNELQRANVDITMDLTNPLAIRYLTDPVDAVVSLTIFKQELPDDATPPVTATFWKGRLRSVRATKNEAILTFESFFTSLRRPGLRARYQKECRHGLYARGCNLDPEDFKITATATAVSGSVITLDSTGAFAGKLRGGMLRGPDNVVRFISGENGNQITLLREYLALTDALIATPAGVSVALYRGCAHNPTACAEFDNYDNYGGFPWIPDKNPFGGTSIA